MSSLRVSRACIGISLALETEEVRREPMSDASSRTAAKRPAPSQDDARFNLPLTSIHRVEADGVQVFYRTAGEVNAPVVLLLHGFPTSSFMFRAHIPRLASDYRVIAPDLPGFGF